MSVLLYIIRRLLPWVKNVILVRTLMANECETNEWSEHNGEQRFVT